MSWRTVVISSNAKLDYQMGYMVVRRMDTTKIHLSEMEILIVESTAVSLTAALLNELSKKKIKVIFCDEKRNPSSELVSYYGSHDTSTKIRTQITWKDEVKKAVWTEIVADKIRKQAEHLEFWGREEAVMLYGYINELEFADVTNREGQQQKYILMHSLAWILLGVKKTVQMQHLTMVMPCCCLHLTAALLQMDI